MRSLSPENAALGIKDPNAALILGYIPPSEDDRERPNLLKSHNDMKQYDDRLLSSVKSLGHKAGDYLLEGCVGESGQIHSQEEFFNDLETLDGTFRPSSFSIWMVKDKLVGVKVSYTNGLEKAHGSCNEQASRTVNLAQDGSEAIVEVLLNERKLDAVSKCISSIGLATSTCNMLETPMQAGTQGTPWPRPDERPWSFRGFFGFVHKDAEVQEKEVAVQQQKEQAEKEKAQKNQSQKEGEEKSQSDKPQEPPSSDAKDAAPAKQDEKAADAKTEEKKTVSESDLEGKVYFLSLGVVWGKDTFIPVPPETMAYPLAKSFMSLNTQLQKKIQTISKTSKGDFKSNFYLGSTVTANIAGTPKVFNALDMIDVTWKIRKISFSARGDQLSGLTTTYQNGKELPLGIFGEGTRVVWETEVDSDLHIAKITAGKTASSPSAHIDTVEFIKAGYDGQLPTWPLDISTLRYLGVGETRVSSDLRELVEAAPKIGRKQWSVRGIYGETNEAIITRLGIVWGRG